MKLFLSVLTAFNLLFSSHLATVPNNSIKLTPHIICIDPGHGGEDPGAVNGDLTEKEVSLNIANRLKTLLEKNNYTVVMTRTNNNSLKLTNAQRAELCNQNKADIAISIHLNSSTDTTVDYTQGLYGTVNKDKKFADFIHAELKLELNLPDPPEGGTTDFADNIMLESNMPTTLQETVFLSSPDEYPQLEIGVRQQQIAQALYTGINNWFVQR